VDSKISRDSIHILVVDDLASMRKIVRNQLVALGFVNIAEARDAREAAQKLEFDTYSLIISDWHMPEMSGFELLAYVRGQARLETTPFILLTKQADRESVLRARESGVSFYLAKPFTAETLEEKIKEALPIIAR
jgi:two-component system chemotaxis response regulator CheY